MADAVEDNDEMGRGTASQSMSRIPSDPPVFGNKQTSADLHDDATQYVYQDLAELASEAGTLAKLFLLSMGIVSRFSVAGKIYASAILLLLASWVARAFICTRRDQPYISDAALGFAFFTSIVSYSFVCWLVYYKGTVTDVVAGSFKLGLLHNHMRHRNYLRSTIRRVAKWAVALSFIPWIIYNNSVFLFLLKRPTTIDLDVFEGSCDQSLFDTFSWVYVAWYLLATLYSFGASAVFFMLVVFKFRTFQRNFKLIAESFDAKLRVTAAGKKNIPHRGSLLSEVSGRKIFSTKGSFNTSVAANDDDEDSDAAAHNENEESDEEAFIDDMSDEDPDEALDGVVYTAAHSAETLNETLVAAKEMYNTFRRQWVVISAIIVGCLSCTLWGAIYAVWQSNGIIWVDFLYSSFILMSLAMSSSDAQRGHRYMVSLSKVLTRHQPSILSAENVNHSRKHSHQQETIEILSRIKTKQSELKMFSRGRELNARVVCKAFGLLVGLSVGLGAIFVVCLFYRIHFAFPYCLRVSAALRCDFEYGGNSLPVGDECPTIIQATHVFSRMVAGMFIGLAPYIFACILLRGPAHVAKMAAPRRLNRTVAIMGAFLFLLQSIEALTVISRYLMFIINMIYVNHTLKGSRELAHQGFSWTRVFVPFCLVVALAAGVANGLVTPMYIRPDAENAKLFVVLIVLPLTTQVMGALVVSATWKMRDLPSEVAHMLYFPYFLIIMVGTTLSRLFVFNAGDLDTQALPVVVFAVVEVVSRSTKLSQKYFVGLITHGGDSDKAMEYMERFRTSTMHTHLSLLSVVAEYVALLFGFVATIMVRAQRDLDLPASFVETVVQSFALQFALEFVTDMIALVLEVEYLERSNLVEFWMSHARNYFVAGLVCIFFMLAVFSSDFVYIVSFSGVSTAQC